MSQYKGQSNLTSFHGTNPFGNDSYTKTGLISTENRDLKKMEASRKRSQASWESTINANHNRPR